MKGKERKIAKEEKDGMRDGMKRRCYVCASRTHTYTVTEKQLHRERRVRTRKRNGTWRRGPKVARAGRTSRQRMKEGARDARE